MGRDLSDWLQPGKYHNQLQTSLQVVVPVEAAVGPDWHPRSSRLTCFDRNSNITAHWSWKTNWCDAAGRCPQLTVSENSTQSLIVCPRLLALNHSGTAIDTVGMNVALYRARVKSLAFWASEDLKGNFKGDLNMLWTILVILLVLWLVGLLGHIGGGLIHLLLVIAAIVLVINLLSGRRAV